MSDEQELTFGQKAVGLSFNPSAIPEVDACKKAFAEIIDNLDKARKIEDLSSDCVRLYSVAITEAQSAQMWAVKAITWKN